jgi:hypothetical protein
MHIIVKRNAVQRSLVPGPMRLCSLTTFSAASDAQGDGHREANFLRLQSPPWPSPLWLVGVQRPDQQFLDIVGAACTPRGLPEVRYAAICSRSRESSVMNIAACDTRSRCGRSTGRSVTDDPPHCGWAIGEDGWSRNRSVYRPTTMVRTRSKRLIRKLSCLGDTSSRMCHVPRPLSSFAHSRTTIMTVIQEQGVAFDTVPRQRDAATP